MNWIRNPCTDGKDAQRAAESLSRASAGAGVSASDMAESIHAALSRIKIDTEREIALIRANPSLSRFQKWRLTRMLRKEERRREEGRD